MYLSCDLSSASHGTSSSSEIKRQKQQKCLWWIVEIVGYKGGGWLVMVMEAFYGTSWKAVMVLLVERAGNLFFCIL